MKLIEKVKTSPMQEVSILSLCSLRAKNFDRDFLIQKKRKINILMPIGFL